MRILLVHERYLPDSGGGGEVLVHRRAEHLQAHGLDVRVVCAGDPGIAAHEGVPTRRLPLKRHALIRALPALVAEARRADLVHAFSYHAMLPACLAARLARRPLVLEHMALFGPAWQLMRPWPSALGRRAYERLLLALPADGRVFLSRESLALAGARVDARTVLAPPGVDPKFFAAPADRPPKEDLVLFAGKFEARKGIAELLAVARACPEIRFAAVGWGGDIAALRADAPGNLAVLESRGDLYRGLLARARILLFPSHAETFGLVVAEAMAGGCAVVGTTGQAAQGAQVRPGDVPAMIAAVRDLWTAREACLALGARNRVLARRYDWARSGAAVLGLYRTLLGPDLPAGTSAEAPAGASKAPGMRSPA